MRLDPPYTLAEAADRAGRIIRERLALLGSPDLAFDLEVHGDPETRISAISPVEAPEAGALTFAVKPAFLSQAENGPAAAVVVPPGLTVRSKPYIVAPEPRLVFTVMLEWTQASDRGPAAAFPANVRFKDPSRTHLGRDVVIGDFTYIGADTRIGDGCRIYPHVFIDDDVELGEGVVLYPHVAVFRKSRLGRRVRIHSGSVIGDDGFGYNQIPDTARGRLYHVKNEHVGGVWIGDDVEIGTLVCVDRGLVGDTVIGSGTKVDNLVQIAHNCQVGRDAVIVAQVGMAGHTRLGDRVFALGQAGFTTGAAVGDDAIIGGQAGVSGEIPAGRAVWSGTPAQKADDDFRQLALIRRELPRVREFFRLLGRADSFQSLQQMFKAVRNRGKEDKA